MRENLKNKGLISIIVPVYNVEHYLEKCILSIVKQTYEQLEIILIDDGSTDGSVQICERWKSQDKRIVVIHKENGGLVSARKKGLEIATGEYIGFVDADDFIESCMYKNMVEYLKKQQIDFVYCGLSKYYELDNREVCECSKLKGEFDLGKEKTSRVDFLNNYVFHSQREKQMYTGGIVLGLYQAAFIKTAYGNVPDECSQGEDLICLTWMLLNVKKLYIISEPYYHYRIHTESISHKKQAKKFIEDCRMMESIIGICKCANIYDDMKESIDFYLNKIIVWDVAMLNPQLHCEQYFYPEEKELEGKKIVVYAAGTVGKCYMHQFFRNAKIDVTAWVDSNYEMIDDERVNNPSFLRELTYDFIIIATESTDVGESIKKKLIQQGYEREKIRYREPMINFGD